MNHPTIPENKEEIQENKTRKETIILGKEHVLQNDRVESKTQIVGFLVSFSKTEIGEYWELREGNKNLIGSGEKCTIRLAEATVSEVHATFTIRLSKNDNHLMFIIADNQSTNGTCVNGVDIEISPFECKNHDKIQIGNYELLLVVIDKQKNNLTKSSNFKAIQTFDYSSRSLYENNSQNI